MGLGSRKKQDSSDLQTLTIKQYVQEEDGVHEVEEQMSLPKEVLDILLSDEDGNSEVDEEDFSLDEFMMGKPFE